MKCDWANDPNAPQPCHVVDLDTGKVIPLCLFADEETGEYTHYIQPFKFDDVTKLAKTISGKGRIQIRPGVPP